MAAETVNSHSQNCPVRASLLLSLWVVFVLALNFRRLAQSHPLNISMTLETGKAFLWLTAVYSCHTLNKYLSICMFQHQPKHQESTSYVLYPYRGQ